MARDAYKHGEEICYAGASRDEYLAESMNMLLNQCIDDKGYKACGLNGREDL